MFSIACYHPAFIQKYVDTRTGELCSKFISSEAAKYVPICQDLLRENYSGKRTIDGFVFDLRSSYNQFIQIPCGKCIGCRMDYKRSWADRLTYHSLGFSENKWFITLTYDDDHISDLDHSDNYDLYALRMDDLSDFIKDLRNKFRCPIDFYGSGEYGDQLFRPHFHLIAFGFELSDLVFWKLNDNGDPIYISDTIDSLWKKGFSTVAPFSWLGAAYTASYVEKKRDGRAQIEYTAVGLTPEKCRMSRRPGIAYDYYMEHADDLWSNNGLSVDRSVNASGHLGLPRYFRKLAEKTGIGYDSFLDFQKRALDRANIITPLELDNSSFDLSRINDMLAFEEREILASSRNKLI